MKIKNLGGAKNMRSKLGKAPVILSIINKMWFSYSIDIAISYHSIIGDLKNFSCLSAARKIPKSSYDDRWLI